MSKQLVRIYTFAIVTRYLAAEEDYLLSDEAGERKHGVNLAESLKRAKKLGGKLFKDKTFYITDKVKPSAAMVQSIVQANGGQVRSVPGSCAFIVAPC